MLLSEPIVNIIYGNNYSLTAKYLQLNSITFLSILFGAQVSNNVLLGQGETKVIMKSSILSLFTGIILGWYLIPRFGTSGLILTNILNQVGLFYNLYWIKRNLNISFNYKTSVKIFVSASISYFTIYFLFTLLSLQGWTKILLAGGSFVLTYLFMILKTKTLTIQDIKNLKEILSSAGPLTPIFNIFLGFFEKYIVSNP
jgi:O-antigen/teichoic acid export membrane protein